MKRMKITLLATVLLGIVGMVFANGTAESQNVKLKLAHVGAPVSPQETIAKMFVDKVNEKSNGSIQVTIYNSGTLGNEKDLQEGVRSGTVDIAIAGTFSHLIPWAGVFETPMLYRNMDHFVSVFSGPVGDELKKAFKTEIGVNPLFIVPHGGFRYVTANFPVTKPSDMKGMKLRNPNVPSFTAMAEAVGAIPVPLDFSELYIALERGTVDGQHNPVGNIFGQSFFEVQKYMSMVPWGISPHIVSMSSKAWDSLSDSQKAIIEQASKEVAQEYPAVAQKEEQDLLAKLEAKMTVIHPQDIDIAAFQDALKSNGIPRLEKAYGADGVKWINKIMNFK